jgi:rhodanese-related sulfurtransferase
MIGLVAVFAFLALGPAAGPVQQDELADPGLRIEWAEFKRLYDDARIEVVDVRGADAFELGHVPRARSVPLDEIERRAGELKALKKPIVLYCA